MNSKKLVCTIIVLLLLFIILLLGISFNTSILNLDKSINSAMTSIESPLLTEISKIIGVIFDTKILLIITLVLSIILWLRKYRKESIFFLISMLIGAGAIYIIKEIIQRPRPLNALITEASFSFPSGHATIAVIFFGILAYLISRKAKSKNIKIISTTVSVLIILIIGLSRLLLNLHWLTDILAGFCLGLFILAGSILFKNWV